jgi:LPXTG-motif cell wall-anchored protein
MNKVIVTSLAATALLASTVSASASSFDISEPLSTNGPLTSPWVASGTVTPAIVDGALLLTNVDPFQKGFALYDEAISAARGIDVIFSQAQWGGDGADGIVFFVKDGSDTSILPGATGGGLGYSPAVTGPSAADGLSGALLGIGLDSYGNFAETLANGSDCETTLNGFVPNAITVRGPGQGRDGYCLLDTPYNLASNTLTLLSNNYATRAEATVQVRVVIDPANAIDPRVKVYYDGGPAVVDVALPDEFNTVASVKIGFSAGTGGSVNNHNVWGLTANPAPPVPMQEDEDLAATGSSEIVGLAAMLVALLSGIAAVVLRRRRSTN